MASDFHFAEHALQAAVDFFVESIDACDLVDDFLLIYLWAAVICLILLFVFLGLGFL
jgi:hypothetical protein